MLPGLYGIWCVLPTGKALFAQGADVLYWGPEDRLAQKKRSPAADERVLALNAQSWDVSQSNPGLALRLAQEALEYAGSASDDSGTAAAHLNAGWALINLGRYEKAVGHLSRAEERFREREDLDGVMKTLNALGVLSFRIGEYEQAQRIWEETLGISGQTGVTRRIAALNNLGELHCERGDYRLASQCYTQAHDLARELDDDAILAVIRMNLGRIHLENGEIDQADEAFSESIDLAAASGDRVAEAEALTQLGRLEFIRHGRSDPNGAGEQLHLDSISRFEEIDYPAGVIAATESLAEILIETGRLAEAEEHLRHAAQLAAATEAPMTSSERIRLLADRYEQAGDTSRALEVMRWCLSVQHDRSGQETARRIRTLEARHETDQARMEAKIVSLRNIDLRDKSLALEASNAKLQLMHRIGSELTSTLDLDEITQRLHDRLSDLMTVEVFGIAFLREESGTLDFALLIEDGQRITPFTVPVSSTSSFAGWVVRNRREICLNDADRYDHRYVTERRPITAKRCRSMVFLPLEIEDRVIGVLTLQSARKNQYDPEKLDTLRLLSPYIAIALENASKLQTIESLNHALEREKQQLELAYEQIAHMANHDTLTELPNRRLLAELVREHLAFARRRSAVFGLLYLDLNNFKPVNDTFGHEAGDRVLVRIADRLRATVRESDTVARIGGDEFVLVVHEVGSAVDAVAVGEKVLAAIREPIEVDERVCRIEASIGVSLYPQHGDAYEALLNAADEAMYRIKQSNASGAVGVARLPWADGQI